MAELKVVRQIKNSFKTLSSAEITTNSNTSYLPTVTNEDGSLSLNTNAYLTKGVFDFIADSADSVSMLADTSLLMSDYVNAMKSVTVEGELEKLGNISKTVYDNAASYANEKLQNILKVWNTKVDISIETLIGDIAPFAEGFDKLGENLYNRFTRILGVLTGTNIEEGDDFGSILSALGDDFKGALLGDEALNESISQLSAVKTVVESLNAGIQVYKTITQIRKVYETVSNTLSIASSFACAWWSGGVTAIEGVNTSAEVIQIATTKLRTLLLYTLKKFIFPIKIKVPMILVGNVDSFSVRMKMMGDSNSWYNKLFDKSYYDTIQYTQAWANSISRAKQAVLNANAKVELSIDSWTSIFNNELADSYMKEITAKVRKTINLEDFPKESIKYSRNLNSYDYYTSNSIMSSQESDSYVNYVDKSNMWNTTLEDKAKINPIQNAEALIRISAIIIKATEND